MLYNSEKLFFNKLPKLLYQFYLLSIRKMNDFNNKSKITFGEFVVELAKSSGD